MTAHTVFAIDTAAIASVPSGLMMTRSISPFRSMTDCDMMTGNAVEKMFLYDGMLFTVFSLLKIKKARGLPALSLFAIESACSADGHAASFRGLEMRPVPLVIE
jgi:hypothetical protein